MCVGCVWFVCVLCVYLCMQAWIVWVVTCACTPRVSGRSLSMASVHALGRSRVSTAQVENYLHVYTP